MKKFAQQFSPTPDRTGAARQASRTCRRVPALGQAWLVVGESLQAPECVDRHYRQNKMRRMFCSQVHGIHGNSRRPCQSRRFAAIRIDIEMGEITARYIQSNPVPALE